VAINPSDTTKKKEVIVAIHRIGAPAMNNVAITMQVNTIAAPRSFWRNTQSATVIAQANITGFSVRSQCAISARLRDNTLAQYNNIVTFSTSDG
jgi:hypothetical protein